MIIKSVSNSLLGMTFLDKAQNLLHFHPIDHTKIRDISFEIYLRKKSIFYFWSEKPKKRMDDKTF